MSVVTNHKTGRKMKVGSDTYIEEGTLCMVQLHDRETGLPAVQYRNGVKTRIPVYRFYINYLSEEYLE